MTVGADSYSRLMWPGVSLTPMNFISLMLATLHGGLAGPIRQVRGIIGEMRQARRDYRAIRHLVSQRGAPRGSTVSPRVIRLSPGWSFTALQWWYLAPLPLYQVADDLVTYPMYLHTEARTGAMAAYAYVVIVTFTLAGAMGVGQQMAERTKARLVGVTTVRDTSDLVPSFLDATVNSAPWQVARRANEPRSAGAPVVLTGIDRVFLYAAAYAVVNTALYALAEKLPGNEWLGFLAMLISVWMLGGMYIGFRSRLTFLRTHPDFDAAAFVPHKYNATYYSAVMEDEAALIQWQASELHMTLTAHLDRVALDRFAVHLDVGSGPSVHHLFAFEKYATEIHVADFLPKNLDEIRKWVDGDQRAHDWTPFVRSTLKAEGTPPSSSAVEAREAAVRSKIAHFLPLDLKVPTASMREYRAPLVTSFFVADSATGDLATFEAMTRNALAMVEPGGLYVAAYLGGCESYLVGKRWIKSVNLQARDVDQALYRAGARDVVLRRFETPSLAPEGFDHVFTATAVKPLEAHAPAAPLPRQRRDQTDALEPGTVLQQ